MKRCRIVFRRLSGTADNYQADTRLQSCRARLSCKISCVSLLRHARKEDPSMLTWVEQKGSEIVRICVRVIRLQHDQGYGRLSSSWIRILKGDLKINVEY